MRANRDNFKFTKISAGHYSLVDNRGGEWARIKHTRSTDSWLAFTKGTGAWTPFIPREEYRSVIPGIFSDWDAKKRGYRTYQGVKNALLTFMEYVLDSAINGARHK